MTPKEFSELACVRAYGDEVVQKFLARFTSPRESITATRGMDVLDDVLLNGKQLLLSCPALVEPILAVKKASCCLQKTRKGITVSD